MRGYNPTNNLNGLFNIAVEVVETQNTYDCTMIEIPLNLVKFAAEQCWNFRTRVEVIRLQEIVLKSFDEVAVLAILLTFKLVEGQY